MVQNMLHHMGSHFLNVYLLALCDCIKARHLLAARDLKECLTVIFVDAAFLRQQLMHRLQGDGIRSEYEDFVQRSEAPRDTW